MITRVGAADAAGRVKYLVRAIVASLVCCVAMMGTVFVAPPADAQALNCDTGPEWTVFSAASLVDAIGCYNFATEPDSYRITVGADLSSINVYSVSDGSVTASFPWITQSSLGFSLEIDGNDRTLWGGYQADATLGIIRTDAAPVTITDAFITAGGEAGVFTIEAELSLVGVTITLNGNGVISTGGDLMVVGSVIAENGPREGEALPNVVQGYGINTNGRLQVHSSVIDSNDGIGVWSYGEDLVTIEHSRIIVNAVGGVATAPNDASPTVAITRSTIADNGFVSSSLFGGVFIASGTATIRHSTITGNGSRFNAALSARGDGTIDAAFVTVLDNLDETSVQGAVTLRSSIAQSCGNGVVNGGGNVGGCFRTTQAATLALADNGCIVSTPQGCPVTFVPAVDSAALGRGDCRDLAFVQDQLGNARTPRGLGCDAGAVDRNDHVPELRGDVNCDDIVNIVDALVMAQYASRARVDGGSCPVASVSEINPASGDVNQDGGVNIVDALLVAQCAAFIANEACPSLG